MAVSMFTALAGMAVVQAQVPPPPCIPPYIDEHVVYFPSNHADLDLHRLWRVRLAADYMEAGVTKVVLRSGADTQGSAASNLAMSQRRGRAVADELVRLGIPESTIEILATGESQLSRATADDVEEPLNRRVVIQFSGGDSGIFERLRAAYCPAR